MKYLLVFVLSLFLLSGCASSITETESALIREQISQPTISMSCPESGCNFSSFEYNDPNRNIAMPTNRNDVINNVVSTTSSVLLGIAPYYAITKAFDHMNDGVNINTNDSSDNRTIDNSVRDNSTRDNRTTDNSVVQGGIDE